MSLNNQQAMVIDLPLSEYARGYQQNEMIARRLFPEVPVGQSGGQVIEFGKDSFLLYNSRRAPGSATKRVDFGYEGKPYACENHALEALVPDELGRDAKQVPGIELASEAVGVVMDANGLRLEADAAKLATDASQYPAANKLALSGSTLWSNAASSPRDDVFAARAAIREATGRYPNLMILPPNGVMQLDQHPSVRERLKYVGAQNATAQMLAHYFDVREVVEGNAVFAESADAGMSDVWGNNIILAYVATGGATRSMRSPSFGYTYTLRGHPYVKKPYYVNNRESWAYGVHYERTPVIAGAGAGFLIQNAF